MTFERTAGRASFRDFLTSLHAWVMEDRIEWDYLCCSFEVWHAHTCARNSYKTTQLITFLGRWLGSRAVFLRKLSQLYHADCITKILSGFKFGFITRSHNWLNFAKRLAKLLAWKAIVKQLLACKGMTNGSSILLRLLDRVVQWSRARERPRSSVSTCLGL